MDECEVAAFFAENEFSDVSESESEDETLPGDYYQGSVVESTPLNNTKTTEVNLRDVVVSSKQQSTKTGAGISSTCSCLGMSHSFFLKKCVELSGQYIIITKPATGLG